MQRVLLPLLLVARVALGQGAPTVEEPSKPEPSLPPRTSGPAIELMRGQQVRVWETASTGRTGALVDLTADALLLQTRPDQVVNLLLSDVHSLELRTRAPGQGAIIGAVVVGVSGFLYFRLGCSLTAAERGEAVGSCGLFQGLLSGVAGAGVGALLGLAVPRWARVYRKGEQGPLSLHLKEPAVEASSHWLSGSGPKGELGLQFGRAREMEGSQPGGGWGWRLHLLALLGPYVALGPEIARYTGIGTRDTDDEQRPVFQLGGLMRLGAEVGPIRASAVAGMSYYQNRSDHRGASVGGTVEVRFWKSVPPLAADVRYHVNLQRALVIHTDPDYLTIDLGTRLRW
jgi:hypothetical protein